MALELPSPHPVIENGFFWISLAFIPCVLLYPILFRWLIKPVEKRRKWDVITVAFVLLWPVLAAWMRTHTGLGLLLMNGARTWVVSEEKTQNPEDAKAILRWIQESGQYGVNAAQDAVSVLPDPHERARLFRLLSDCAINDGWRETYLRNAESEESEIKKKEQSPPPKNSQSQ